MGEGVDNEAKQENVSDNRGIDRLGENDEKNMHSRLAEEPRGRLFAMEEKWKLIYNENQRSPNYSVSHYISYLRRYVEMTSQLRAVACGKTTERFSRKGLYDRAETRPTSKDTQRSLDSISPMSYFIRKLKLDLKLAFFGFVEEFAQTPCNGLRLLLGLLKNLQVLSAAPGNALLTKGGTRGTLKMEEYKRNMVDEQDCLLCIKYCLRAQKSVSELLDHNAGLLTVALCVLSNFSRSRVTALEILTLLLSGPTAVDRVLDTFTSLRIMHAESCRFKMMINMLYTRGVSHVLFQVTCLRMLNTLLNLCKSANMRVHLQFEMEEAGLDLTRIQQTAVGDGLEFDDLRKEIWEWKMRYLNVDAILQKMKTDLKVDAPGSAVTEFNYDQHFGKLYDTPANGVGGITGMEKREDSPYWKTGFHDEKVWTPEEHKGNVQGGENPPGSQRPGPIISSVPKANVSSNITGKKLPVHSGKYQDEEQIGPILSRAASPTHPRPTDALVDAKDEAVAVDFDLDGLKRVTAELWEPYGMVISHDTAREGSLPSDQNGGKVINGNNWTFESSSSRYHQQTPRSPSDGAAPSSTISSTDDKRGRSGAKDGEENSKKWSQDTSKLFYSPKTSGIDAGPLRWFNPGITVPDPTGDPWRKHGTNDNSTHSKSTSSKYNRNVHTPSPDYSSTPPPDYNDPEREQRPHCSPKLVSPDHVHENKPNGSHAHQLPTKVAPPNASTTKSNFQRWPAVRRKSLTELSKPKTPSSTSSSSSSHDNKESQAAPPLPPPRVLYSTDNAKSLTPSFSSAHVLETNKSLPKQTSTKYLRHGHAKHAHSKPESSLNKNSGFATDVDSYANDTNGVKDVSLDPEKPRWNFVEGKPSPIHPNISSNSDYSPGIPSNQSPKISHSSKQESKFQKPHHFTSSSSAYSSESPPAKSTIIVSSNQTSHVDSGVTFDGNTTSIRNKSYHSDNIYAISKSNGGNTKLQKTKPVAHDKTVPTAITITSPTPPLSMSDIHGGIPHKNQPKIISSLDASNNPPCHSAKDDVPSTSKSIPPIRDETVNINHSAGVKSGNFVYSAPPGQTPSQLHSSDPGTAPVNMTVGSGQGSASPGAATHTRQDSMLSYTSEIGRVLGELDQTLETHGWQASQASVKEAAKTPRPPLVAYV